MPTPHSSRLPRRYAPPGRTGLGELPHRVIRFLRAVGTYPELRLALARVGYRKRDHEEALALLAAVLPYGADDAEVEAAVARLRPDPRAAEAALRAMARRLLPRLRAALRRKAPSAGAHLFEGLLPFAPEEVAPVMARFLERLDAADDEVLRLLEARGFGPPERARARALLEEAQAFGEAEPAVVPFHVARAAELRALWGWWAEWSAAAQSVVERGDLLRQLDIAGRRGSQGHADELDRPST